jgi:hypothetical protein
MGFVITAHEQLILQRSLLIVLTNTCKWIDTHAALIRNCLDAVAWFHGTIMICFIRAIVTITEILFIPNWYKYNTLELPLCKNTLYLRINTTRFSVRSLMPSSITPSCPKNVPVCSELFQAMIRLRFVHRFTNYFGTPYMLKVKVTTWVILFPESFLYYKTNSCKDKKICVKNTVYRPPCVTDFIPTPTEQ